jgi:hypothetical protein
MDRIELQISDLLRATITGAKPVGFIKCEAGEGTAGFTGGIKTGLLRRRKDICKLLNESPECELSLSDLLLELREASRTESGGPWYRCNIHVDGTRIAFQYFWENAQFTSVAELEPSIDGRVPHFVFERRFDRALVQDLTDFDVNTNLFFYAPARIKAGKPVTASLLEVFATQEWQSDVNNGAMNQYFGRDHEPMTGLLRSSMYGATYRGLLRIGHAEAAALFAESISSYAHFYPRVEAARAELGFPAVPKQEQSDAMSRYYALERSLDPARVRYIREHIVELEQG